MSTLATMKSRIADELARDDLTSQIAYAISDAIVAYNDERFYFNETRGLTFSTVAAQEFYDSDNDASIGLIQKIDHVHVNVGDIPHVLLYERPGILESLSFNGSQQGFPWVYTFFDEFIRLYPIPDQAYTVRVTGTQKIAAPASDDETGNRWMVDAERLIRARAKNELALHVLKDTELAATMAVAVKEAEQQLRDRTNQMTQADQGRVYAMEF